MLLQDFVLLRAALRTGILIVVCGCSFVAEKQATAVKSSEHRRATPVVNRLEKQQKHLNLPILPTTTIGSFPQTLEIRKVRGDFKTAL